VLEYAGKVRDPLTGEPALRCVPKVPELPVMKRKARPVPENVLSALMETLPTHTVEALTLTLFFGFRRGEVFGLQAHNIDFDAGGIRLYAENVKDAEDTFLPGGPEAMGYLQNLADQAAARGTPWLITWRPYRNEEALAWRPLHRPRGAWTRVMREIEEKFGRRWRWHDIRAAFITHVARTSGQLAAQTLARHSDYSTTKAYVEVAAEFRREAANLAARRPALALVSNSESPTQHGPPPSGEA
jgi:integrase